MLIAYGLATLFSLNFNLTSINNGIKIHKIEGTVNKKLYFGKACILPYLIVHFHLINTFYRGGSTWQNIQWQPGAR